MAPLVLLMKALSSSNDLMPVKSNLIVRFDISFRILDILSELTSSSRSLVLMFWSKSFINDLNSLMLTFNFSSAFAKRRILFIFLDSVTFSAISSYFSLNFCMILR